MKILLADLAKQWNNSLWELFKKDPSRGLRYVAEGAGLRLDYSKHWLDDNVISELLALIDNSDFEQQRKAMFSGHQINLTENRSVLHTALRAREIDHFHIAGASIVSEVFKERNQAYTFAEAVRNGSIVGISGKVFTDVVSIGIGGSNLGPLMVTESLKAFISGPRPHYVSNIDGTDLKDKLHLLNPETTLILIASKTFTTQETMHNASKAKQWICDALGKNAVSFHFAAISANEEASSSFGIPGQRIFKFWDWVGGRYSVWSSIGLSIMIALGADNFKRFLNGAHAMDCHFRKAPPASNIPIIMALIGMWYRNGFGLDTLAVLPYGQRMHRFTAYLQQLEMESNGKRIDIDGKLIVYDTCPIIWGEAGTNGQHAFFQLLHQGTVICPIDFIITAKPTDTDLESHQLLLANCLAQAESLAFGKSESEVYSDLIIAGMDKVEALRLTPHRSFPGNRPSSILSMDALTPENLGALIAAYEHKVFTQGILWNINSFDQYGVELGKAQSNLLRSSMESGDASVFSSSTQGTIKWLLTQQN